jgi:hypothetical protein
MRVITMRFYRGGNFEFPMGLHGFWQERLDVRRGKAVVGSMR